MKRNTQREKTCQRTRNRVPKNIKCDKFREAGWERVIVIVSDREFEMVYGIRERDNVPQRVRKILRLREREAEFKEERQSKREKRKASEEFMGLIEKRKKK